MPQFRYRAVDHAGEPHEGIMDEGSAADVTAILQERGFQVNSVERIVGEPKPLAHRPLRWEDIDLLNAHLVSIAKPGLPFAPALKALAEDIGSPRLRRVLKEIQRDLERGSSMEQAFSRHPQDFPPEYSAILRAGERTGNLLAVLEMLNQYSTRMVRMKNSLKTALFYPSIVLTASAAVFLFLLIKVVPEFKGVFSDIGGTLPAPTLLLIAMSDFLYAYYPHILFGLAVVVWGLWFFAKVSGRDEGMRATYCFLLERVPIIGQSYRVASMARFSRCLGLLLTSGVPTLESLDLAGLASGNERLRRRVRDATRDVANGVSISEALGKSNYFSRTFLWIIGNSEERSQLPEALLAQGDSFDRELDFRDRVYLPLLAPLTVVLTGLPTGFVVVAMYLPIFTLGDAISG